MICAYKLTGENRGMRRINLIDGLTVVFTGMITLMLILFYSRFPLAGQLIAAFTGLLLLAIFISTARHRWRHVKIVRFLCDFSPVFFINIIYQLLGRITPYMRPDVDGLLNRIDLAIFGAYPTVWLERLFFPWVADILALAYSSYYFIPLVLILTLYFQGRPEEFSITLATLLLGYYMCFIGYIFMPAIGPRFTLASLQNVPFKGGAILDTIVKTINSLEGNQRDCFPSGHTQTILISLWFAFKFKRPLFWVCLPVAAALIVSTVYLRFHYGIDIIAGFAAAVITVMLGYWLVAWELKNRERRAREFNVTPPDLPLP
jgi:membrane-associated phospholipid phosphatase